MTFGTNSPSSNLVPNTQMDEYTQLSMPGVASSSGTPAASQIAAIPNLYQNTWGILLCRNNPQKEEIQLDYRFVDGVRDCYSLGRSRSCDVHVDKKRVSSLHCTIFCDYTQARMRVFLEDHSVNGTYINDSFTKLSKGERIELRSGDEIYLLNPQVLIDQPNNHNVKQEVISASFHFVNIRDRIAANREVIPASSSSSSSSFNNHAQLSGSVTSQQGGKERNIEDFYIIGDKIGSGMSGQVYLCVERATQRKCAVKEIDTRKVILTPGISIEDLKQEAKLMQQLKHPGIIEVLDSFQSPNAIFIVMELVDGGDLFDRIVEKGHYSEDDARIVMQNVLSAVHYLHKGNIIHRDLKPENILLVSPHDDTNVKVTDFGLAKKASHEGLRTFCGTPQYFAPEVLKQKHATAGSGRYGTSADMWSLGVILYIMLSGSFPFDEEHLFDQISTAQYSFSGAEWDSISTGAKHFIRSLLTLRVDQRITVDQALKHPWVRNIPFQTHPVLAARSPHKTSPSISHDVVLSLDANTTPDSVVKSKEEGTSSSKSSTKKATTKKSLRFSQDVESRKPSFHPLTMVPKAPLLPYQHYASNQIAVTKEDAKGVGIVESPISVLSSVLVSPSVAAIATATFATTGNEHISTPSAIKGKGYKPKLNVGVAFQNSFYNMPVANTQTQEESKALVEVNLVPSSEKKYIAIEKELSDDEIGSFSEGSDDEWKALKGEGNSKKSKKRTRKSKEIPSTALIATHVDDEVKNETKKVKLQPEESEAVSNNTANVEVSRKESSKVPQRQQSLIDIWKLAHPPKVTHPIPETSTTAHNEDKGHDEKESAIHVDALAGIRKVRTPMKSLASLFKNVTTRSTSITNPSNNERAST